MFRDALIENGIDPDDLLGERSNNQVSLGQLDEIRSVLEQCIPAVISQSAETLLLPVLMGISLQVCYQLLVAHVGKVLKDLLKIVASNNLQVDRAPMCKVGCVF